MDRRAFLKAMAATGGAALSGLTRLEAALPQVTITKVRIFTPPNLNQIFNQSNMVVTVETSNPQLIGIGEGGARDTLEQCAGRLIGRNPFAIERLLARYVSLLVLPARARKNPCTGCSRSGALGLER